MTDEVLALTLDRPIAFHRCLVDVGGGIVQALFLGQAIYWSQRSKEPGGWFFNTRDQWAEQIGLSRSEQERARAALIERGLIEEDLLGVPARLHYRVLWPALRSALSQMAETRQLDGRGLPAGRQGSASPDGRVLPTRRIDSIQDSQRESELSLTSTDNRRTEAPSSFETFWKTYPATARKVAKAKCREVWVAGKLDRLASVIVAHVEASKLGRQWIDGFEPAPLTYLRGKRWEDGAPPPDPRAKRGTLRSDGTKRAAL